MALFSVLSVRLDVPRLLVILAFFAVVFAFGQMDSKRRKVQADGGTVIGKREAINGSRRKVHFLEVSKEGAIYSVPVTKEEYVGYHEGDVFRMK